MTWRSVIFSKVLILIGMHVLAGGMMGASIRGEVKLLNSRETAVKKKNDFSGVVVWLTSDGLPMLRPIQKHALMLQKNKTFSPHILTIQTGTTVDFPNFDPIFHNAFSNFDGVVFDIGLYAPGSSRSVRFAKPGIVKVFCNIHPSMAATIAVLDSSDFAISDKKGHYTIPNVPSGTYQLHFFHERATPETLRSLDQTITVGHGVVDMAAAAISEAGYLPVEHKNKYGRDYPANSGNTDTYSLPIQ